MSAQPLPSTARDRILGKLRAGLAQAPGHPGGRADEVRAHFAAQPPAGAWPVLIEGLVRAMVAVRTEVHVVREADWPEALRGLVQAKAIGHLLLAPGTPHGARAAEALKAWPEGAAPAPVVHAFDQDIEAFKPTLFGLIDAGFTRVRSGIAETGSLVLWPDAHEPRSMSLVPPIHIALLDARRMHATLHEAMVAEGWAATGMPTNALLVSGPSKTSDIQQTLAYGAHGPRQLVLLLVLPDDVGDVDAVGAQALAAAAGALS